MRDGLSLLSVLTLLGAAHGIFLALALLNTKNGDKTAHRILCLFTFLLAVDLGEEFLFQTGFFNTLPHLLQILAPVDLLYGPVLYFYILRLTLYEKAPSREKVWWHLLPAVAGALLLLPFYLGVNGSEKLRFVESMRTGFGADTGIDLFVRIGVTIFGLLTVLQIGAYIMLCIKNVGAHYGNIKNEFSDIEKINLFWLRNMLLGLSLIYSVYLGDQFFPDLLGMNLLGDAVTILAVLLIYTMGYLGLRQPSIFTHSGKSDESLSDVVPEQQESRYRKSGLGEDSSHAFLEELTTHMEVHKPYLKGGLTLPELAGQLGISSNYLSQIINEQRQQNFYDFINGHRVEEAKRLIRGSEDNNLNILQIAFESGFNSKSAFYSAFKKVTGMTPKQYSKQG